MILRAKILSRVTTCERESARPFKAQEWPLKAPRYVDKQLPQGGWRLPTTIHIVLFVCMLFQADGELEGPSRHHAGRGRRPKALLQGELKTNITSIPHPKK